MDVQSGPTTIWVVLPFDLSMDHPSVSLLVDPVAALSAAFVALAQAPSAGASRATHGEKGWPQVLPVSPWTAERSIAVAAYRGGRRG